MRIAPVPFEALKGYAKEAKRDGAWITQGKTPIRWYGLHIGQAYVGSVGLLPVGRTVRVRGWFVRRAWRGRGLGIRLLWFAVEEARRLGFERIECRTVHHRMVVAKMPGVWRDSGMKFKGEGMALIHDLGVKDA